MENENAQEIKNGYVFRKIHSYANEHHPDSAEDAEYLLMLCQSYHRQYTGYLFSGMPEGECEMQAFTNVFNAMSSPYSELLEFIYNNETKLTTFTKNEVISEKESVLALLPQVKNELQSYIEAKGEALEEHRGKQLLMAILTHAIQLPATPSNN